MRYLLVSGTCYALGIASISYAFLFLQFETLQSNTIHASPLLIAQNILLFLLFPLQHSLMARKSFKEPLQRIIHPLMERPLYVGISAVLLFVVLRYWKPFGPVLYDFSLYLPFDVIFYLAIACILWSSVAIDQPMLFGWKHGKAAAKGVPLPELPLRIRGPFRWIRHPLTTFLIIAIWSHETLTASRLLLNVLLSAYSLIGVIFEERDLRKKYGADYELYQREVPAFIPSLRRISGTPGR